MKEAKTLKVMGYTLIEDTTIENGWWPGDSVWKVAIIMAERYNAWSDYRFGGYVEEFTGEGFVTRIFQAKHEAQAFIDSKQELLSTQSSPFAYKVGDKFIREANGSILNMEIVDVFPKKVRFHYTIEVEGEPQGEYTTNYGRLAFHDWLKTGFQRV